LNDGFTQFTPGNSGLAYWNETMGPDNHTTIADVVDANMNGVLDINSNEEIANYFLSLTSMPNAGVDVNGDIYCAYTALAENFFDENNDGQFYRHVYLIKSEDGGATWSEPFDVITPEFIEDLFEFTEAVFPFIPSHNMQDGVNLMFMRDFKPGISPLDDDPLTFNEMLTLEINDDLVSSTQQVVDANEIGFKVFPNPAAQSATLQFELLETTDVNIAVLDISGKIIQELNYSNAPRGMHQKTLNASALTNGTYFVQVRTDDVISMQKLMVLN